MARQCQTLFETGAPCRESSALIPQRTSAEKVGEMCMIEEVNYNNSEIAEETTKDEEADDD